MTASSNLWLSGGILLDGDFNSIKADGSNQIHVTVYYSIQDKNNNNQACPDQDGATVTLINALNGKDIAQLDAWQSGWRYTTTPSVGNVGTLVQAGVLNGDLGQAPARGRSVNAIKDFFVSHDSKDGPILAKTLRVAFQVDYKGVGGQGTWNTAFVGDSSAPVLSVLINAV